MKKILMILLSVTCLIMAGCGKKDISSDQTTEKSVRETESSTVAAKEIKQPTEEVQKTDELVKETEVSDKSESNEIKSMEDEVVPKETSEPQKEEPKQVVSSDTEPTKPVEEPKQEEPKQEEPKQEEQTPVQTEPVQPEPQVVSYSPQNVVALATSKTKAAGKVLLTENLDSLLEKGQISKEEYNEYYPYDGAGYYSVFVDTNLAEARDVSGTENLNSEDKIAQYISEMLMLENGPYFLIEYAGTIDYYGKQCYEFRCYRA